MEQDFLNWEYFSKFSDDRCENLKGKPKLFFFPTCRGKRSDFGIIGKLSSSKTVFLLDSIRNTIITFYISIEKLI